ncbi:redox-sensing transcriptional repressor Rex [Hominifimenecus microfluidus]|uniref:Redox-sensing transcriptional repressor Rex n=1 Tax=Hominifimenecus microfluidus TaxID=2885348 RepID=A0AAE3JDN8_9FIRM|nr:redox-sensing transcriptional repressor Rex [Hominifimenecus microfluidus]MCC2230094.1 redox-sensing transcriptional repressor Rex [Hominifimenecus microfluidus]
MEEKSISAAVIKRLPRYYRYLSDLQSENVERISSDELSKRMGVTASQIRQDLNNFGGFGQQGYGYNVEYLRTEIGKILGLDKVHNMVIIGGGNLGRALAGYANFESRGFVVKGIFDSNPELVGTKIRDIKIMSMGVLETFLKENDVAIVALAIPRGDAVSVAKKLYDCGIRAIWNFAHVDLDLPSDAFVENVHLSESLMQLSYRLNSHK